MCKVLAKCLEPGRQYLLNDLLFSLILFGYVYKVCTSI